MNARFADYVTSGAFQLSLTRGQISNLALLPGPAFSTAALERKGLVEVIPDGQVGTEARLTAAGLLCLAILREAGLVNAAADPVASEVEALRAELVLARNEVRYARLRVQAALSRKEQAEREAAALRCELEAAQSGVSLKPDFCGRAPVISLRDPLPHLADSELAGGGDE